jgi:hypothetical protein
MIGAAIGRPNAATTIAHFASTAIENPTTGHSLEMMLTVPTAASDRYRLGGTLIDRHLVMVVVDDGKLAGVPVAASFRPPPPSVMINRHSATLGVRSGPITRPCPTRPNRAMTPFANDASSVSERAVVGSIKAIVAPKNGAASQPVNNAVAILGPNNKRHYWLLAAQL